MKNCYRELINMHFDPDHTDIEEVKRYLRSRGMDPDKIKERFSGMINEMKRQLENQKKEKEIKIKRR